MDVTERNSRQIRLGKATVMQVTSHIPFHLFLTTKGGEKTCEILMAREALKNLIKVSPLIDLQCS